MNCYLCGDFCLAYCEYLDYLDSLPYLGDGIISLDPWLKMLGME